MSSQDEQRKEMGPSTPESAEDTASLVADATGSLEDMHVQGNESPGEQTPTAKEPADASAAPTPSLDPLTSVTDQTDGGAYFLRGSDAERIKTVAGILPEG